MKLFYTLLLSLTGLLISSPSIAQGSLAALDTKNGFKDAKFGMPFSAFTGMVPDNEFSFSSQYHKYYTKLSDNKAIGLVPLQYISYHFYKNILVEITFVVKGKTNCNLALQGIQEAYGPGSKWPTSIDWKGKHVKLVLTYMQQDEIPYHRYNMSDWSYVTNDIKNNQIKAISKDL